MAIHGDFLMATDKCGHPDLFRSVRYLGFAADRCPPSGELQGRSSVWLPAWLPSVGHHRALVLVTTIGPLPGAVTAPCPSQAPPPNPIAAEPDGRRVLSRGGAADHEVTPKAPLTGSGWREHSYGGFGGGHPHFHPHAAPPGNPRIERQTEGLSSWARGIRRRAGPPFPARCPSMAPCPPPPGHLAEPAGSPWLTVDPNAKPRPESRGSRVEITDRVAIARAAPRCRTPAASSPRPDGG